MLKTKRKIAHIPMHPKLISTITDEGIEIRQQIPLNLIKPVSHLFAGNLEFFRNRVT